MSAPYHPLRRVSDRRTVEALYMAFLAGASALRSGALVPDAVAVVVGRVS